MRIATRTLALLLLLAGPAAAQSPGPEADRGYAQAIGGVASTATTDQVFGGGAAVRAVGPVYAFVEMGRLRNGIWTALDNELAAAETTIRHQIEAQFGTTPDVTFDARVPLTYGLAGARLRGPRLGMFGTYVEAGGGLARLRPEVHLEIDGESLDDEVGRLLQLEEERTELMTAVGAGLSVNVLRRIRVEAGYRFSRIHGNVSFNSNRAHLGVGYGF